MTTTRNIDQQKRQTNDLEAAMQERIAWWEQGGTSPSASDYTADAERITGITPTDPDAFAEALYDAECGGADLRTLAMLAVGRLHRQHGA
jgi:hypothetical protein